MAMKEQIKQKEIITWLESLGAYVIKVISANRKGCPDIVACVPTVITSDMVGQKIGAFVAIEVKKSTKDDASPLQGTHIEEILSSKGKAGKAVNIYQARAILRAP